MSDLLQKHCVPCEGGVPTLTADEAGEFLKQTPDWEIMEEPEMKIRRQFKFKDFVDAIKFVNVVSGLSEAENHHPDIHINYSRVTLTLWTHAIGGLSENDFIMAAKVNALEK